MSLISSIAQRLSNLYFKPQASETDIAADNTYDSLPLFPVDDGAGGYYFGYRKPDGTFVPLAQGVITAAPVNAKYIVQTADGTLTNEQALSALSTGIVKNTTGTGVLSIAAAGTDYLTPAQVKSRAILMALALG